MTHLSKYQTGLLVPHELAGFIQVSSMAERCSQLTPKTSYDLQTKLGSYLIMHEQLILIYRLSIFKGTDIHLILRS